MTKPAVSLRLLMTSLIDYAGLFPPSKLPLPEAIQNYARYRLDADRWMLSRFIIPYSKLEDLTALVEAGEMTFSEQPPFEFSVLGRAADDPADFLAGLAEMQTAISAFQKAHNIYVRLAMLETKLPPKMTDAHDIQAMLNHADDTLLHPIRPFYEVPTGEQWQPRAKAAIEAIAAHNAANQYAPAAGFKLRCGGVEAAQFPPLENVAFVLDLCRDAGVPLKATAGLHHPIRHFNDGVQTKMHGFINVFGAGVLAKVHHLDTEQIEAILVEEEASQFTFSDEQFGWRDLHATVEQIAQVRENALVSFGSCSFDEPREDLQALELL